MKLLEPGEVLDGFRIEACIHSGGMAHIYRVVYADGRPGPGFDMAMKVPRMTAGDGAENIVSFEVECQIMQALSGPHTPRFVAAGDLVHVPYLVMEYVQGRTLQHWLDGPQLDVADITRLGAAVARAAHALHQQNTVHLDLKPANVLIREDGSAVLLDFGLSCHAHFPDLLAEQLRKAVGSPAWIAPEQVVGVRGDPRSDVFAIGVMLYQLCTAELPFGEPLTQAGLRQRLWMDPVPPRKRRPEVPAWLQEVVLRCLEPEAAKRYPSAAHLAFDLAHPTQVHVTQRGTNIQGTPFRTHFKRWIKAAGMHYQPSPLPAQQLEEVPIVMVAVPHKDASDATLYSLRQAVARSLGTRPGARLACVTVISGSQTSASDDSKSETHVHRRYLSALRQWAQPLDHPGHQMSCHVLESSDVAQALLDYARGNQVSVIVMGAATHGLKTQRFVATVPIKVAMEAPCTLILVKQALPFEHLGADVRTTASAGYSDSDAESGGLSGYGDDLGPLG
ncbi:bifunctional serine/threonine-protein kinase/universal stress protein [Rhodoferax sp. TBRC 17660]|uniref:Bifunctional serine/threonine-protein kinase/universal stress protein n=1 Tax=Rhodoferax potami TaxID=3068338 RepID=A0ABU3KNB0_9BURK|nr:bifunctional serine/threonine-protein kinase/universal stress protein [Rhodoferax sp. TBRC 17660]MDT7519211.1 bifunctional serine/threonine-protein kinase/universal stress protein [Rhodoferax sp. TBRC 17660]